MKNGYIGYAKVLRQTYIKFTVGSERYYYDFAKRIIDIITYDNIIGHNLVKILFEKWLSEHNNAIKRIEDESDKINRSINDYVRFDIRSFVLFLLKNNQLNHVMLLCSLKDSTARDIQKYLYNLVLDDIDDTVINALNTLLITLVDFDSERFNKEYDKLNSDEVHKSIFKGVFEHIQKTMNASHKLAGSIIKQLLHLLAQVDTDARDKYVKQLAKLSKSGLMLDSNHRYYISEAVVAQIGLMIVIEKRVATDYGEIWECDNNKVDVET